VLGGSPPNDPRVRVPVRSLPLLLLALPGTATAAEVAWDGFYASSGHLYNSLSLSDTNTRAEGASAYLDHRARLAPSLLLSDKVSLRTQVDLLPWVLWGGDPVVPTDITTGEELALTSTQAVEAPTTDDGAATLQNIAVTRLWGELNTGIGIVRFGRMPVEWGTGMVFNAGNNPTNTTGDTADRVQITSPIGPVHVIGGLELPYEGFVGEPDDLRGAFAGVLYQSETAALGTYHSYRWQKYEDDQFGAWIGDLWAKAQLGPAVVEGEFAAIVGSGDLSTGANDVSIVSFGANLGGRYQAERLRVGLGLGLAGGDGDDEDSKLSTFSFDPNFDVALLMFEQPMPMLETQVKNDANGGRDTEAVRITNGVQNALYLRPSVGWQLNDMLTGDLSLFAARATKLPDDAETERGYGTEVDLDVNFTPFEHFLLRSTTGVLLPGPYLSDYEHDDLGGGFDRPVFGTRLVASVEF
jgi:hypothetical protein